MNNKKTYIKSPIAYMGNKYGLLKKIAPLFPKKISTFVDVFGGSGTMSINFGDKAIYNEYNEFIKLIVEYSIKNPEKLSQQCDEWFKEYNLYNDRSTKEKEQQFKNDFLEFRNYINKLEYCSEKHIMGIYALHVKAINNLIRFNSSNGYNASAGFKAANGGSLKKLDELKEFNKRIIFYSFDFKKLFKLFKISSFDKDSLFYFDPPYRNTTAVYNEKKDTWTAESDLEVFKIINKLNELGFKFAYSNTLIGKDGTENTYIKKWADINGYKINYIDKKYISFGKLNTKNSEVLITNYEIESSNNE